MARVIWRRRDTMACLFVPPSNGSRTLRPQDTSAPQNWCRSLRRITGGAVSRRNCPGSKCRSDFPSITALVSKCLVPRFWRRSVSECLDAEVSCGRSVRYSLELCRSVSKSEGRRHLRSWAAVNSSYLVTVPWQPLVDVRLAMQDRKRGTHFRITWDATISVSKYSYDSWRRFCLHISAFRRGDVCEVTKEVELGSKYFWLYRPNLCVYWSWWQPFTALTVNTFLSPFSWKKTPVRRALWYICLILVAPLAHLTGRATWHFSRRIIVWTPFDTATAFPEVPCYRRRYLRHVGPIADDSDEVQFFSHLLYSGLVTMWNESTRLKSRAIAGNRAMPL